ncbi:MAG: sulfatase [Armatimonadetes bacterium]|nr:sulfatase [Armatimonadota bacterium]
MNLILWTCHDTGVAIGPYGDRNVATPQLDRLAASGTVFERNFCTTPLCSPSRGAIQTGRYPHVNGLIGLVNQGWDQPAEGRCLTHLLAAAGYHTSLVGFQHIRADTATLGFDEHFAGQHYRATAGAEKVAELLAAPPREPFYIEVNCFESHRVWDADDGSVDPAALTPPPYWPDSPEVREDMAGLYRHVLLIDRAVGTVLDALERTGCASDTLFVFTVDHGIPFPRCKSTLYDSGIQTALLIRGDGVVPAGARCPAMISNVDLLPTLLDLLGLPKPGGLDGRSFARQATGAAREPHRQWIFSEKSWHDDYDPMRCVRTERWKYIRNLRPGPLLTLPLDLQPFNCPTARAMHNAYLADRPAEELYDVHEDPHELHNQAADPTLKSTVEELRGVLDDWMEQTGDPFLAHGYVPAPAKNWQVSERGRQWYPGGDA